MPEGRRWVVGLWTLLALLVAVITGVVAKPMMVGWSCYAREASGEQASAELARKLTADTLVLRITSGTQDGSACTATTSPDHHAAVQIGDTLSVVHRADRPGDCVLTATLENSAALLWSFSGAYAVLVLLILWVGVVAQRRLTAPAFLNARFGSDAAR